jgi:Small primase-like proteins (Toprim domain)
MRRESSSERDKEAFEAIEEVIADLNEKAAGAGDEQNGNSFLIVVEGRRDVSSLRNLGIKTEIEILPCANKPIAEFCEGIAETGKSVIILTDWDRKGGILASALMTQFRNLDTECDGSYREKLLYHTKKEIKDVESLYTHFLKLKRKINPASCDEEEDFKI